MKQLSVERLEGIFLAIADGIVMQDTSGAIVTCNPAAERLLGLTMDQMMGRSSLDPRWRAVREGGADLPGDQHPAMVTLASGEPVRDFIMGIALPEGGSRWLSVSTELVKEGAKLAGVLSTFSDVSLYVEARASAFRHQRLVDDIRLIQVGVIAGEASERTWNSFLALLLRASAARSAILLKADGTAFYPLAALTRDPGTEATARLPIPHHAVHPAGALLDLVSSQRPRAADDLLRQTFGIAPEPTPVAALPLVTGGVVHGVLILTDYPGGSPADLARTLDLQLVTGGQLLASVRAEQQRLRVLESKRLDEERLRLVLDATGIGHWDWNPESDHAVFDEQWCRQIGYASHELQPSGKTWDALLHPEDRGVVLQALIPHLAGTEPQYRTEFRMRHKDGHWVWIMALGLVLERNASGKATRMVGVHLDVTREKTAADELSRARDIAERANRAKSEFLAAMSHEIRTPMNGVLGVAHLLLGTGLNVEQRGFAETIKQSGEILLTLIDDILDFSKIEAERLEIEGVPFDPQVTVAEVADMLVHRAEEKGIDFIVDWDCVPPARAIGDPKRIRQVLINLVGNAVKFTDAGTVTLRIRTPSVDVLRFEVADTGAGIPAEMHEMIFERFRQADGSTTRRHGAPDWG